MRAVVVTEQAPKGPVASQIRVVDDWPEPESPSRGELLVRAECTALNRMDIWVGRGIPGVEIAYPHVGGVDGCGRVEAVGEGVDAAWVGQRIVHNAAVEILRPSTPTEPTGSTLAPEYELIGEHSLGTHRERYCIPAANAVAMGDTDPSVAAAYGLTALTAYSMMFTKGELRPGQIVLITGIGGGVATAALSLARWAGCEIVVTSRHEWKLERALQAGAHHAVHDQGEDWSREVRRLTAKRGVDMVIDTTGQATHLSCVKSLARGGAYVCAGATSGAVAKTDLARLFWNQLRLLGSTMGTNDEFREVMALLRARQVAPIIDRRFAIEDARLAWERLEASEQMGKLVLDWS